MQYLSAAGKVISTGRVLVVKSIFSNLDSVGHWTTCITCVDMYLCAVMK